MNLTQDPGQGKRGLEITDANCQRQYPFRLGVVSWDHLEFFVNAGVTISKESVLSMEVDPYSVRMFCLPEPLNRLSSGPSRPHNEFYRDFIG